MCLRRLQPQTGSNQASEVGGDVKDRGGDWIRSKRGGGDEENGEEVRWRMKKRT